MSQIMRPLGNRPSSLLSSPEHTTISSKMIRFGFKRFCSFLYKRYCPLSATGLDHLPDTPFMLCSNHSSHMDTTALIFASQREIANYGVVAAQDYFFQYKRKLHLSQHLLNLIPVSRKASRQAIVETIKLCSQHVEKGCNLIVYPEGTRSTSNEMLPFKHGAALIALNMQLPIVPAYVQGTKKALPKGQIWIRPTPIIVHFGKAIQISQFQDITCKRDAYAAITQQLWQNINELKEQFGE